VLLNFRVCARLIARARFASLLLAVVLVATFSDLCFSQTFTSSITGKVTDPSGAGVPGANIQLRNMATNDVRDYTSQTDGGYQFSNLVPGTYEITATAAGFKTYVQQNLVLQAQTASTVNLPLEIGGSEQRVQVTDSAILVDTQTANNVVTLESRLIQELPNATRNPLNFVFSLAGTTAPPGGMSGRFQSNDQMTSNFGLNGL
jgi:hypothetical protein